MTEQLSSQDDNSADGIRPVTRCIRNHVGLLVVICLTVLVYAPGKLEPVGYHSLQLALHLAAVCLVYMLMNQLLKSVFETNRHMWIPAIAAMIFAIHPINTESVNYLPARGDVLCCIFYLAAVILSARAWTADKPRWSVIVGMVACFVAALSADPAALTLPAMVLLYDFLFVSCRDSRQLRRRWFIHVPLWGIAILSVVSNLPPIEGRPVGIVTQIELLARYARLTLLPVGLNVHHEIPELAGFFTDTVMASVVFAVLTVGMGVWLLRRHTPAGYGLLWFFITLIPASNVVRADTLLAEHDMYLPSVGFAVAFAWLLGSLLPSDTKTWRTTMQSAGGVCVVVVALIYGITTCSRNTVWDSKLALWTDAADKGSGSVVVLTNLAEAAVEHKQYHYAMNLYNRAARIDPENPRVYAGRAELYMTNGSLDSAISEYRQAVTFDPDNAGYHADLAAALSLAGRAKDAQTEVERALAIDPDNAEALYLEGKSQFDNGEFKKAADLFERAIDADPTVAEYHDNLGLAYIKLGDAASGLLEKTPLYTRALAAHRRALELDPESADSHFNIGNAYARLDRVKEAIAAYEKAIELRPNWPDPYVNLGGTLLKAGDPKGALARFNQALKLDPSLIIAQLNRGIALLQLGQTDNLVESFTSLLDKAPQLAPTIYLMIGHAKALKKDFKGARQAFQSALDARPGFQEAQSALDAIAGK